MANSNFYNTLGNGGTQTTTLSDVIGKRLTLPGGSRFIESRRPGEIQELFLVRNNTTVLYSQNAKYIGDSYLKGPVSTNFRYRNIEDGQRNKLRTRTEASRRDAGRITRFLGSTSGRNFILKQLVLQGFQPFDETKVYNPASPIISALRLATFGLIDRPTRHLDTSNIIGGLLGGTGLGSTLRTIGGLFGGGGPPVPAPPRSSVASKASGGFGLATFTSMIGGGDRSDQVVTQLARPDVRDLLRGQTATNAYNAPRYSKLVPSGGKGGFFKKLLSSVGKSLLNKTILGGIIPPKQPWKSNYRADEKTYDYYLNAGGLFSSSSPAKGPSGGIGGLLKSVFKSALGLGTKANYSGAVNQRWYKKSDNPPNFNRSQITSRKWNHSPTYKQTNESAFRTNGRGNNVKIQTKKLSAQEDELTYSSMISITDNRDLENSDQLFNYKLLTENPKDFSDLFADPEQIENKDFENVQNQFKSNIESAGYKVKNKEFLFPQQFDLSKKDKIGFNYITKLKIDASGKVENGYAQRWTKPDDTSDKVVKLSRLSGKKFGADDQVRKIRPTNGVDYVNSLSVIHDEEQFKKEYSEQTPQGVIGPDLIKFYFHDLVNNKYIPFSATVTGISENNTANYDSLEYIGRADSLYYYRNFTRTLNFSFKVVAHSIKELLPMWKRINYLTTLTKPANYTTVGKFIVPPMVLITIGDLYKKQPVFITSVTTTIPDDASWEILTEEYAKDNDWFYGAQTFKWEDSKRKYAQFPRECDLSVNMNLIEKDKPQAGRNNFGDAPVLDDRPMGDPATFSEAIRIDTTPAKAQAA